jgi:site-specific DNA-cytosine methylase
VAHTLNSGGNDGGFRTEPGAHLTIATGRIEDDPLLPIGLDSNRYRCCGNGVVSSVSEWIGHRLMAELT